MSLQPEGKAIILLGHQPMAPFYYDNQMAFPFGTEKEVKELEKIFSGKNILGAFCGNNHKDWTVQFLDFNVFVSGALSGSWWELPNPDGTPQGYRIIQVKDGNIKSVYTNREGLTPISLVKPMSQQALSGMVEFEISVVDFGKSCKVTGMLENRPIVMRQTSRTELWSFWKGTIDSQQVFDGERLLKIMAKSGNDTSQMEVQYLVHNNIIEPFNADASAMLSVHGNSTINTEVVVMLNGEQLGKIPPGTGKGTLLTFDIPKEQLKRLNRVMLSVSGNSEEIYNFGPIWMTYQEKQLYDQRDVSFQIYKIGRGTGLSGEKSLFYVLP
jgi:hypothetical protein